MKIISFVAIAVTALISFNTSAVAHATCNPNNKEDEIRALALNIYFEARGTGPISMQIVGETTLNRVESIDFPDSICEVVYQPGQFSWTKHPKKIDEPEQWKISVELATDLINGDIDYIDNGATYFISADIKRPSWTRKMKVVAREGNQIFYSTNRPKIEIYIENISYSPTEDFHAKRYNNN